MISSWVLAENIDPDNDNSQYGYGENVGWLNAEPLGDGGPGIQVSKSTLTGWMWAENLGWISLSCENTSSCGAVNYGVTNDGAGTLAGWGWAENAGWISFSCINTGSCGSVSYGVTIDSDGDFDGFAYGENIGWIHFQSTAPIPYKVKTCVVNMTDLEAFINQWLEAGPGLTADLNGDETVDLTDYSILTTFWIDYCPDSWPSL
jgi:hypothetical protein